MWRGNLVTRLEKHFGNRIVRCFTERPPGLHSLLSRAVARNPDGDAVICGASRLSYRELDTAVGGVAAGLRARRIGKGDRVAIILGNRVEFVILLFAIARLGAIAVPLSVREQLQGLRHCLRDCGAKLLVHDAEAGHAIPPAEDLPHLRHCIRLGARTEATGYGVLETGGQVTTAAEEKEEDVAAILYTSGTTGTPKGAMLTHLGIVHSTMHYELCMGVTSADRSLACVPLSHVTGLVALIATAIRAASTLIIMPAFRAAEFLELAAREQMSHTLLVPAMYKLCLLQQDFADHDLSSWRVGGYGGAPMPAATIAELRAKLPSLRLMNAYGATETTSPATLMPPEATEERSDSVGIPVPCGQIVVMDDEGREVPVGREGEVWIGGPMVVPGYWNNPVATAEEFAGGFWKSGDIGTMDEFGYLRVADRKKDVINRGGYKIFSVEVDNVLLSHPDIVEAAVVAEPCPVLGERVHAFVVPRTDRLDLSELQAFCATRLADYKVPERFTAQSGPLPRNANGKVMKRQLREMLFANHASASVAQANR